MVSLPADADAGRSSAGAGEGAMRNPVHHPVLLNEVVEGLDLRDGLVVVDGTVGAAGHAREIARAIAPAGVLIGIDRDEEILEHARNELAGSGAKTLLFHRTFDRIGECLEEAGVPAADRVLLDLGASSLQLDSTDRGFSFMRDAPLDLRMDRSRGRTAAELLRRVPESELVRILRDLGEEPAARRIASAIVARRETEPITRTGDLAEVVARAVPPFRRRARIHPATLSFMALRMAINDELPLLEAGLGEAVRRLRPGGRLAVISFHSLEDRRVKTFMKERMDPITRKPIRASEAEVRGNPRSRSAKLRIAVRSEEV
jgi:16S rRNA (cytosine1402-N4)-methyltransferase